MERCAALCRTRTSNTEDDVRPWWRSPSRRFQRREPYGYEALAHLFGDESDLSGRARLVAEQLHRWIRNEIHSLESVGLLLDALAGFGDEYQRLYDAYRVLHQPDCSQIDTGSLNRFAAALLHRGLGDAFSQLDATATAEAYRTCAVLAQLVSSRTQQLAQLERSSPPLSTVASAGR